MLHHGVQVDDEDLALRRLRFLDVGYSLPTSRSAVTDSCPIPKATRRGVQKRLASTGIECPFGFSNRIAGPPARYIINAKNFALAISHNGLLQRIHELLKLKADEMSWLIGGLLTYLFIRK